MGRYHTLRNDDVSVTTDIHLLMETHRIATERGIIHACGVLMDRLWDNKEVWLFLNATPGLVVALHGLTHADYSTLGTEVIVQDIQSSLAYWERWSRPYKNRPQITSFFPPWNRVSPNLEEACRLTGLKLDSRWKSDGVWGGHSWEYLLPDRRAKLIKALEA
jgi:hypothetical protein